MKSAFLFLTALSGAMANKATKSITLDKEFKVKGQSMKNLMKRALEDQYGGSSSTSHLASYTIKFQGCHHIQQWNQDADEDDEVKIMTKRLVRFRMVPADQCSNRDFKTVSARYGDVVNKYLDDARSTVSQYTDIFDDFGDYVVDLSTFVTAYLEGKAEEEEGRCALYADYCSDKCAAQGYSDDIYADENESGNAKDTCMGKCYEGFGLTCGYSQSAIDPYDYAQCAQLDLQTDDDANDEFYLGPYCAEQGGTIKMGIFSDNTCTTFSSCGADCAESKLGYSIPGSSGDGLINQSCMSCSENYVNIEKKNNDKEDNLSNFDYGSTRNVCAVVYNYAGKCEKHMKKSSDKTDAGCSYISGVKILTSEGTVDPRTKKRSTLADLSMGMLGIGCVFFGMYIFYLKDKLSSTRFA